MFTFIGLLVSIIGTNFYLLLEAFWKKLNSEIISYYFMFVLLKRHFELTWGGSSPAAWLDSFSWSRNCR